MPYRKHSPTKKAEAIALATVIGAEAAGNQLGIDRNTIRRWMEAAGKAPADAIARTDWEALGQLALARTMDRIASGKASAVETATVAGIAERNKRKPEPEPVEKGPGGEFSHLSDAELARAIFDTELIVREPKLRAAFEELLSGGPNGPRMVEMSRQLSIQELADIAAEAYALLSADEQQLVQEAVQAARERVEADRVAAQNAASIARLEDMYRNSRESTSRAAIAASIANLGGTPPTPELDEETQALLAAAEAFLRESAA